MIIVCPNSSIDILYELEDKFSDVNRITKVNKQPGGKGFNVARALNTLNYDYKLLTFLGNYNGKFIIDNSKAFDIDYVAIENDNRICINVIGTSEFEILESGPTISDNEVREYLNLIDSYMKTNEYIVLSGSLPKCGINIYKYICDKYPNKVIVDTSSNLEECYNDNIFALKINESEFEYLCNKLSIKGNIEERLMKLPNKFIFITRGSEGSIVKYQNDIYILSFSKKYEVVNPIGSGDCVLAGMIYSFSKKYDIIDIVKFANACGVSNAISWQTGHINKSDLESIMSEFVIVRKNYDQI